MTLLISTGAHAFDDCYLLENIIIPDNNSFLKFQGNLLFSNSNGEGKTIVLCLKNIDKISIPQGVTDLGDGSFATCKFKEITLPETLTGISGYTFYNCKNLETVTILSNKVAFLGEQTFTGCDNLKTINFAGSEEEWKKMEEHPNTWNGGLGYPANVTINYNYTGK